MAIIGGGPGGYEAALAAVHLGADVTVVERSGAGGSAVLTDVVPSKTLIATAELMTTVESADDLGVYVATNGSPSSPSDLVRADLDVVDHRVRTLAEAQSVGIREQLENEGVRFIEGTGRLETPSRVAVTTPDGARRSVEAETVLIAVGAGPRVLPDAMPDGERILTWTQLYGLDALPERLIVVGSGVTGAEFASAYEALGSDVVLISSRDRVLPGEDADAAEVLEAAFARRGLTVMAKSRASAARRTDDGVQVTLADGRTVDGSHVLIAVGAVPNTEDLGLVENGITLTESGHVSVDRVSRTSVRGVYAAGDCTGVFPLASVAAMQGRIAMYHALGESVHPLDRAVVSSNIFTAPEIATVGVTAAQVESGEVEARVLLHPFTGNARAKMQMIREGFVKLICDRSEVVIGGVVVAPRASELIYPISLAVKQRLTVDQLARTFTVYPSLTGSIAEAARRLHRREGS